MAKKKRDRGAGKVINGETANAWERRTRRELLTPDDEGGFGYSEEAVKDLEARLDKDGRKLKDEPPAPKLHHDKFSVVVRDEAGTLKDAVVNSLPDIQVGARFVTQLHAEGGYEPLNFQAVKVPGSLVVTPRGIVDGVFTKDGQQELTVKVTDRFGQESTASFTVNVLPVEVEADEDEEVDEDEDEQAQEKTQQASAILSHLTSEHIARMSIPVVETAASNETTANDADTASTTTVSDATGVSSTTSSTTSAEQNKAEQNRTEGEQPATSAQPAAEPTVEQPAQEQPAQPAVAVQSSTDTVQSSTEHKPPANREAATNRDAVDMTKKATSRTREKE